VSSDPYRLPTSVRPTDYRITIRPDLSAETFSGEVEIDVVVEEATTSVVLNADKLTINSASITAGSTTSDCSVSVDAEHERLTLTPENLVEQGGVEPGPATVAITFDGLFDPQLMGLYLSRYTDDEGVEHKLATTQFEATAARKCFPCWDEPEFKATFAMSLVFDETLSAVANTPEVGRQSNGDGTVRVDFAPSMVMSSYLVAFVVGPLEMTDPIDVDGVPLRVVHVPGKGGLTDFALEAGAFALRYFTDYFGLPYPDQKLDLVAIPDFAFGAMENVGCVIFREVALLIDPDAATQPELQRTADVINHEIAHMWFGDLVTMKWWNGLWLNEAFATFMEMRCTDAFRPGWQRWTNFGLSRTEAFDTDALATTRPIEYEVISPADADGMFDVLTYEKGAAVVRMLEQYLGEDRFQAGIRRYMETHKFGNAETTDLWDALEDETGEPVRRIMDSWIFQGGFPLVTVLGDEAASSVSLVQERMGYEGGGEAADQIWSIPLRYRWAPGPDTDPIADRMLIESDEPATLSFDAAPDWLVVNADGAGFVRTAYPDHLLEQLAAVGNEHLSPVERYALVDDTWASVLAGRTSTLAFLNLLEAMTAETDRSVWQRMIRGFGQLKRLVDGEAETRMTEIAHDAIAPSLAHLGLAPSPDDDDQTRQLRADLVRALGVIADDPELQEECKRTLSVAKREPELVDASLRAAAIDVVAANGDEADFDDFVKGFQSAQTPQDELRYLYALVRFPEPELIERVHAMVLDGSVRSQNAPLLLGQALTNVDSGRRTWAFIAANWDRLIGSISPGLVVRMVGGLPSLDLPEDERAAAAFFAERTLETGSQTLAQILEKQRVQVSLRAREADNLGRFLTS
jgi:puromycin-sensitive aminopeptidase